MARVCNHFDLGEEEGGHGVSSSAPFFFSLFFSFLTLALTLSLFSFSLSRFHPTKNSYLALSRPWNLPPSIAMVFAGAAAARARTTTAAGGFSISSSAAALSSSISSASSALSSVLTNSRVWHVALSTAAIALGSMVVNDYFDVPNDRINAPTKPLPSGQVSVDGALVFAGSLYLSTLVAAAWLEPRELRLLVASSAAVTLAYTPVLKKIALAKTAAVAGVIALSPAAGALASVASSSSSLTAASLAAVAPACWLAFFAVAGRELLMDAADARGDGAAGVATLPVLFGRRATLVLATGCEVVAAAVLCSRAVFSAVAFSSGRQGGGASFPYSFFLVSTAAAAAVIALGAALVVPAARAAREALKLGRLRKKRSSASSSPSSSAASLVVEAEAAVSAAISRAVDAMMSPLGLAVVAALVLG